MAELDKAMRIAELSLAFGEVDRATEHPDGRRESDTTHTVMLALLCIEIAPPEIAYDAAIFALVHDLLERWTLDVCTAWGLSEAERADKRAREAAAMRELEKLGLDHVTRLVKLYEAQETRAARFVRYLDKVTPKLTHLLNGGSALRRIGMTAADMRAKHHEQGLQLAAQYPEQHGVRELFGAACDRCEVELAGAINRQPEIEDFDTWEDEDDGDGEDDDDWSVPWSPARRFDFDDDGEPDPTPPARKPNEQEVAAVGAARDFFAAQRRRDEESARKHEAWRRRQEVRHG